jgi:hypothetical protein
MATGTRVCKANATLLGLAPGVSAEEAAMACRVGITTNVEARRAHWLRQHPNMRNWQILASYYTQSEAQAHETRAAREYGCAAEPGGPNIIGIWHVYYFEH